MVFASIVFLLGFLPVFFVLYFLSPARFRNVFLVGASSFFYFWGAGWQILILLGVALASYWFGSRIHETADPRMKRRWLFVAVVSNLGLLVYFKYAPFLIDTWNGISARSLPKMRLPEQSVLLPLGISFFVFETLSYVVDVYRFKQKPARSALHYAIYLTLFPHLIAGPIYRYGEIERELDEQERDASWDRRFEGAFRFLVGLGKKLLLANTMGRIADFCFDQPGLHTSEYWIGTLAYAFQIYFDFAGYSDMAIGLAKIVGFDLPENFDFPYAAGSVTEFWRRWHMTLSRWFRDYLYVPLGGNRHGRWRTARNLLLVFLLCGLWHGANWTFVVWGLYHGALLTVERLGFARLLERAPRLVGRVYTFAAVCMGWVYFRAKTLTVAHAILGTMTFKPSPGPINGQLAHLLVGDREFLIVLAVCALSLKDWNAELGRLQRFRWIPVLEAAFMVWCLAWSVAVLATETFNPFIYFRF